MSPSKTPSPAKSDVEESEASLFLRYESPFEAKDNAKNGLENNNETDDDKSDQDKPQDQGQALVDNALKTVTDSPTDSPTKTKAADDAKGEPKEDLKKPPLSEEAVVAAAAAAIQATSKEDSSRPWPIDQLVSHAEYEKLPAPVRESLVESADFANGHTYIRQIESKSFETEKAALDYLVRFSCHEGFTFSKSEAKSKLIFTCDHDQIYSLSRKRSRDSVDSLYEPCPFQVEVVQNDGLFSLNVVCAEHNHGPTGPAASAKRRRYTYFQKTLQDDFVLPKTIKHATAPGTPREEPVLEATQVDHLKALVGALRFDNALLHDQVDEYGRVTHLFWTTKDCVEMLAQYPEVLFINFTKSPNVPYMIHIVGMTAFNTTFEIGYGFINEVGLADFRWVMYSLKDIVSKYLQKDFTPSAVITHRESMLISAVDNVFENTNQICVTQLMREVNDKVNIFVDPSERQTFVKLFHELVDSETPDIFTYNETDFRKKYAKTRILEFVTYHWLIYKTRFVRAWVDQHLHFNNYSMGKAEIAQATLKDFAEESGGDLLKIYYRIKSLLKRKKEAHEEQVERELVKCPVKFFVPFYDDVRFKISTHALEMIKEQHELYLEAIAENEPLHRCTRMFTTTTGLPCKHTLSRPVTMDDCHAHWWLSKQRPVRDTLSESDRLAHELTSKFDRVVGLVKQHFFNYSSLESREFMLSNMVKYFTKAGVDIDSRSGLTHTLSSASLSSMGSSARTPPPPATPPPRSSPAAAEASDGSPLTISVSLSGGEDGDSEVYNSLSGAADAKKLLLHHQHQHQHQHQQHQHHNMAFNPSTPRRCGRCNQVGHNSRTCGHRLPLNDM